MKKSAPRTRKLSGNGTGITETLYPYVSPLSVGADVAQVLAVPIEEEAVASAEVDGMAAQISRDRLDRTGEIGVYGQFHIGRAIRHPGLGIVGRAQIVHRLQLGLAPEVVERDGIVRAVEAPEPVVGRGRVRGRRDFLGNLGSVSKRRAGHAGAYPEGVIVRVRGEHDGGPARAGIGGRPRRP